MLGFAPLSTLPFGATPAPLGPYVRPAAASADISFNGTTYTSPAYNAANLTFVTAPANNVTAVPPVATFGVPIAAYARTSTATGLAPTTNVPAPGHRLTQPTSGISTTSFGVGFGANYQRPVGFSTTGIGAARIFPYNTAPWPVSTQIGSPRLFPFHVAPWPVSTRFGGVGGNQFWRAPTMAVVARLGTPTTPTNRTGEASGFAVAKLGSPLAIRHLPPNTNIICMAEDFKPVHFGTPAANWDQSGQVQVVAPTVQFGAPRAITAHHVDGLAPIMRFGTPIIRTTQRALGVKSTSFGSAKAILTQHGTGSAPIIHVGLAKAITTHHVGSAAPTAQFGAPTIRTTHRVSGFKPVQFGTPRAILTQHATGTAPKARFGTPKTIRSNWYEVRGFCPFRSGTPRGYQRNNRRADGFGPVQFGAPAAFHTHCCTSIPPIARLGRPLLKRNTTC